MRSTPAGTCPTAYAIQPPACKPTSQPTSQRGASADENERFSGNLCESTVMAELSHRISRCGEASEAGKHDGCGSDHVATAVGIRRDERNESEGRPRCLARCRPSLFADGSRLLAPHACLPAHVVAMIPLLRRSPMKGAQPAACGRKVHRSTLLHAQQPGARPSHSPQQLEVACTPRTAAEHSRHCVGRARRTWQRGRRHDVPARGRVRTLPGESAVGGTALVVRQAQGLPARDSRRS
jgi:hypothetical protein